MKRLIFVLVFITIVGCNSESAKKSLDTVLTNKKETSSDADSLADLPPSQAQDRERLSRSYDDVKRVDSIFINGADTLKFHMKYYCLKNIDLIIPKFYEEPGENDKKAMDVSTHPFVFDIVLVSNRDTVLNKNFDVKGFDPFFKDNFGGGLKKYGTIIEPYLSRQRKDKNQITVGFSISIPTTDLGIGMKLILDKSGNYQIPKVD